MDPMGENLTIAWTSQETPKLNSVFLLMSKNMESNWNPHHGYCKKRKESSAAAPVSQTVNFNW